MPFGDILTSHPAIDAAEYCALATVRRTAPSRPLSPKRGPDLIFQLQQQKEMPPFGTGESSLRGRSNVHGAAPELLGLLRKR